MGFFVDRPWVPREIYLTLTVAPAIYMILGIEYLLVEWMDGWMDIYSEHSKSSSLVGDLVLKDPFALHFTGSHDWMWGNLLWGSTTVLWQTLGWSLQWPGLCAAPYLGAYDVTENLCPTTCPKEMASSYESPLLVTYFWRKHRIPGGFHKKEL